MRTGCPWRHNAAQSCDCVPGNHEHLEQTSLLISFSGVTISWMSLDNVIQALRCKESSTQVERSLVRFIDLVPYPSPRTPSHWDRAHNIQSTQSQGFGQNPITRRPTIIIERYSRIFDVQNRSSDEDSRLYISMQKDNGSLSRDCTKQRQVFAESNQDWSPWKPAARYNYLVKLCTIFLKSHHKYKMMKEFYNYLTNH